MISGKDISTFIFIGRSGCGKGTQAELLIEHLKKSTSRDSLYIQTGAELREFIKHDGYTSSLSRVIYEDGGMQPEFLAVFMWTNILVKSFNGEQNIVFDGSPRKLYEAEIVDSIIDFYKLGKPKVIHIDISKEEAMKRLLARGRSDDNQEDIEHRLSWYDHDVVPTIKFYENNPRYEYIKLNGEQSPEKIFSDLLERI